MATLTPGQKMAAARAMVQNKVPYFRAALFGAVYKELPHGTLNTMAMSATGILLWDPADVERHSVDEVAASILHELLHWLRDHNGRRLGVQGQPALWNYAADMEINDDIRDMGMRLPQGVCFAAMIPADDGQTAEVYYQKLRQQQAQQPQPGQGEGDGAGDSAQGDDQGSPGTSPPKAGQGKPGKGGKGKGQGQALPAPGLMAGACGGCAGNPTDQEKDLDGGQGAKGKDPTQPDGGEGGDGRSEAEIDRMRKAVANAAVKHAQSKGRGTVPAGFLAWAEGQVKPPKINWRTKLQKVVRSSMAYRPGAVTTTYHRFGRKQAALGYGNGRPVTPAWRNPVPRIMVAVDTSGSMGTAELERAASEVDGILKAVNSEVEFTACDCQVHSTKTVRSWQDAVKEFKGGGGTSFKPVFEYIQQRRNQLPPEILIFITDGCGDAPLVPPPGLKVVWVLVGRHKSKPYFGGYGDGNRDGWGEFVEVDEDEDPQRR